MAIRTVLIADGNARLAQLLAQLLADEPEFSVLEVCSSAAAAVRRARQEQPDVVLVAERLGGRQGTDVCRDLRGLLPDATLLLWSHDMSRTASADEQVVDGLLERGLTFRELVRAVRHSRHEPVAENGIPIVRAGDGDAPRLVVAPAQEAASTDDDPTDTGHMLLACDSCQVELSIGTRDMPSAVEQARAFFTEHADCETSIDLTRRASGHRTARTSGGRQSAGC